MLTTLISGCIIWDRSDVSIILTDPSNGTVEILAGPLGSTEEEEAQREFDLGELIYDVVLNDEIFSEYLQNVKGELIVKDDELFAKFTGSFNSSAALHIFDMSIEGSFFVRRTPAGHIVLYSNGKRKVANDGTQVILWPSDTTEINYTEQEFVTEGSSKWNDSFSLLPEYESYLEDKDSFIKKYVKAKLKKARAYLKDKIYIDAYSTYTQALRADPGNKEALAREKDLYFANYYNDVLNSPMPGIEMNLGFSFDPYSITDHTFIDGPEEIKKLEAMLGTGDEFADMEALCAISKIAGTHGLKVKRKLVSKLDSLLKNVEGKPLSRVSPRGMVCLTDELYQREGREDAFNIVASMTINNAPAWEAYSRVLGYYLTDAYAETLPGTGSDTEQENSKAEIESWIVKGDNALKARFDLMQGNLSAREHYEIFKHLFTRNSLLLKLRGIPMTAQSPVDDLTFNSIYSAAALEPDNVLYRSLLGMTQVWVLTHKIITGVTARQGSPGLAFQEEAYKYRQNSAEFIQRTRENLMFVHVREPERVTDIRRALAQISLIEGNVEEAEAHHLQLVTQHPEDMENLLSLTAFYLAFHANEGTPYSDKSEKLIGLLKKKNRLLPEADAHYLIGKLSLLSGQYPESKKAFRAAIKLDRNHAASIVGFYISRLLVEPQKAVKIRKELIKEEKRLDPDTRAYLKYIRGLTYAFEGEEEKAYEIMAPYLDAPIPGIEDQIKRLKSRM
jgi:tetratricopeptide (TPR) repeat protein